MELSIPSTQYIMELTKDFGVSTDHLLGMKDTSTISVNGLSQQQVSFSNPNIAHIPYNAILSQK